MNLVQTKRKRLLALNLTSLIDVLFILIIFFSVSSTFLEQPGIELKLPEAESSEQHTSQKLILYVDDQNNVFLNDQLISLSAMIDEIAKLGAISNETSIVLKADARVSHGAIIRIMDILRKNGIYKIVVSTLLPE